MIKLRKDGVVTEVYTDVQASAFTKVGYEIVKEETSKEKTTTPKRQPKAAVEKEG